MTEGETFRPQGCYETIENGKIFIECIVNSNDSSNHPKQTVYRRKTPTSYANTDKSEEVLGSFVEVTNTLEDIDIIVGPENKPDGYVEIDRNKPYIK